MPRQPLPARNIQSGFFTRFADGRSAKVGATTLTLTPQGISLSAARIDITGQHTVINGAPVGINK